MMAAQQKLQASDSRKAKQREAIETYRTKTANVATACSESADRRRAIETLRAQRFAVHHARREECADHEREKARNACIQYIFMEVCCTIEFVCF